MSAVPDSLRLLPPSLLGPLVETAAETLRDREPDELTPHMRRLLGFRKGLRSETARRQMLQALAGDDELWQQVLDRFALRPDVVRALRRWDVGAALERVAEASDRGELDVLASALAVERPEGWEYGLGLIVAWEHLASARRGAERDHRVLEEQVEELEEARRRAEAEAARWREQLERVSADLRGERASRREREEAARREAEQLRDVAGEREREMTRVRAELERVQAQVRREADRAREAEDRVRVLERELREARLREARLREATAERSGPEPLTPEELDVLVRASEIARRLAAREEPASASESEEEAEPRTEAEAEAPVDSAPRRTRRVRVPLPPGLVGPTVEGLRAALLGGATTLIVDGYNVSMMAWGDAPLEEQRERLCQKLDALQRRVRAPVVVVFDGAEVDMPRATFHGEVRVVFSEVGREADEVVIDQVRALPLDRPVIVVSSDHWVCDTASAEGALVVPSGVFLAYLRK